MLFLALACAPKTAEVEAAPEPTVRVLKGPWTDQADALAVASTGSHGGTSILVAVWVDDGVLSTATSLDVGRGWTPAREIDRGVVLDDAGQMWPRVGLALGRPVVLYAVEDQVRMAQGGARDWEIQGLADVTPTGLGLGIVWDEPVAAWSDITGAVSMWDGEVRAVETTSCTCCRPAVRAVQAEAEIEVALGQGCDGPTVDGDDVLRARDGVVVRSGTPRAPLLDGWTMHQARGAAGVDAWVEQSGPNQRAVLGGVGLITSDEPVVLGDPVYLSGEIWLPFRAGSMILAAWRPADTT